MKFFVFSNRFVGLSERISTTLQHRIDNTHKKNENFAKMKLRPLLDSFCAVTWIIGPAASGKTFMLTKKAHELAEKDSKGILFLCHNTEYSAPKLIAQFQKYGEDTVQVHTYDEFLAILEQSKKEKSPAPVYQHIFADEAESSVSEGGDLVESIQNYLFSEDSGRHHLWIAYDPNDCLTEHVISDTVQKQLAQASQLKTVVGSSEKIYKLFMEYFASAHIDQQELTHAGSAGLKFIWEYFTDTSGKGELVVKHLKILLKEKVERRDICVLVENQDEKETLVKELRELSFKNVNAEGGITIETVENFRGQRSKVVILLAPPTSEQEISSKRVLYIGLSRCSCYLIVISRPSLGEELPSGV